MCAPVALGLRVWALLPCPSVSYMLQNRDKCLPAPGAHSVCWAEKKSHNREHQMHSGTEQEPGMGIWKNSAVSKNNRNCRSSRGKKITQYKATMKKSLSSRWNTMQPYPGRRELWVQRREKVQGITVRCGSYRGAAGTDPAFCEGSWPRVHTFKCLEGCTRS